MRRTRLPQLEADPIVDRVPRLASAPERYNASETLFDDLAQGQGGRMAVTSLAGIAPHQYAIPGGFALLAFQQTTSSLPSSMVASRQRNSMTR